MFNEVPFVYKKENTKYVCLENNTEECFKVFALLKIRKIVQKNKLKNF